MGSSASEDSAICFDSLREQSHKLIEDVHFLQTSALACVILWAFSTVAGVRCFYENVWRWLL